MADPQAGAGVTETLAQSSPHSLSWTIKPAAAHPGAPAATAAATWYHCHAPCSCAAQLTTGR
eukprot:354260-Chlamydomonas_euryale.AAC.2